jgi:hypothetical protein
MGSDLSALDLWRVVDTKTAADIKGVSEATIQRTHAEDFVQLSPRRKGLHMFTVLGVSRPTLPPGVKPISPPATTPADMHARFSGHRPPKKPRA